MSRDFEKKIPLLSVILSLVFAAVAIIPVVWLWKLAPILAYIYLFVPAAYCIFGAVRYFGDND